MSLLKDASVFPLPHPPPHHTANPILDLTRAKSKSTRQSVSARHKNNTPRSGHIFPPRRREAVLFPFFSLLPSLPPAPSARYDPIRPDRRARPIPRAFFRLPLILCAPSPRCPKLRERERERERERDKGNRSSQLSLEWRGVR
jgi:hypothetical protein